MNTKSPVAKKQSTSIGTAYANNFAERLYVPQPQKINRADQSHTPLEKLLHQLNQRKQLDVALSLPLLNLQEHHSPRDLKGRRKSYNDSNRPLSILSSPVVTVSNSKNSEYKKRVPESKQSEQLRFKMVFSPGRTTQQLIQDHRSSMINGTQVLQHKRL